MGGPTTMSVAEIAAFAADILETAGTAPANAQVMARSIAAAERDGIASHGLIYLPIYVEHVRCGKVDGRAVPGLVQPRPGVVVADAACGFAHPAIAAGAPLLIAAAHSQGVAVLAVRNSYNSGVLGHHTEAMAADGVVALGFTNAPATIAPLGGRTPVVGTNPFSLAVPDGAGGVALLIDQSASVIARSEVVKRHREGQAIPEGWVVDAEGQPTTDPEQILKGGTMAPSGGYKGVGIGILTEVMAAALTGATLGIDASPFSGPDGGPPRTGQMFLAIDPAATSGGAFARRIADLAAAITAQPGARLPGARRLEARARHDREGIAVSSDLLANIRASIP
ncbi:MAG: Ldh family oxidoreductase [Rhodospirillaceae bacterium]|nr:Ldh family oxidoreductase [Rhodospirillaceae bacterium]